jgi:anti-sigma regulatory factor (Ser/Thr protein kinase)
VHHAEITLEGLPSSVPAARHFVEAALDAADAPADSWTAVQLVSELATNAVVHAATRFTVEVTVDAGLVRIGVTDERPAVAATKRRFSDDTTTGRGLRLVDSLSRSWGVDTAPGTKTVWCEIVRVSVDDEPELTDTPHLIAAQTHDDKVSAPATSVDGVTQVRAPGRAA